MTILFSTRAGVAPTMRRLGRMMASSDTHAKNSLAKNDTPELMIKSSTELSNHLLSRARRVVVKFGSRMLVDDTTGEVRSDWLQSVARDIADMHAQGKEVLVVTSGSVSYGID